MLTTSVAAHTSITTDVMIVGFGPVGKLLAIKLGRQGHSVVVIDRNMSSYPLPRAVTHCSEFARALQSVGLAPDTIASVTEPYDDMYVWRNGDGHTLVEVDWSGRGESGWYNTYFFHQPALEAALDRIVAEIPSIRVMRGWEAIALSQGVDSATVSSIDADGNQMETTAAWVIAADGANSTIRQRLGIHWHDEGYFFDWLVVDAKLRPGMRFPHVAVQNCSVTRPSTMVPGGPGRRRWEFMRLPGESKDYLNRPDTAWQLLAPFGITPDNADLERQSVYTFQACWASEWRKGRVVIAGDARPPHAAVRWQGLGAGVRDVMNLSWKLDAVLNGVADEGLIDSYGSERLEHAREFVRFSTDLGKVICTIDPVQAAKRDSQMIAEWTRDSKRPRPPRPRLGAGIHAGSHGGTLSRQGRVRLPNGLVANFDDAFTGPGALLAVDSAALRTLPMTIRKALADFNIELVALRGPSFPGVTVVDDVDGTYRRWLDELGATVALVRPDFYLYGVTNTSATDLAAEFLDAVAAKPRVEPPTHLIDFAIMGATQSALGGR